MSEARAGADEGAIGRWPRASSLEHDRNGPEPPPKRVAKRDDLIAGKR